MASVVFTVPLVQGKTEQWKKAVAEMNGPRAAEHVASCKRRGLTRELVCLQPTPMGDTVCVLLEGNDPMSAMKKIIESTDPFDQWFVKTIFVEAHGMKPSDQPPAPQVMSDWKG